MYELVTKEKLLQESKMSKNNIDYDSIDKNLKYLGKMTDKKDQKSNGLRNLKSHWEYKKFGTPKMDRKFIHDPYQSNFGK